MVTTRWCRPGSMVSRPFVLPPGKGLRPAGGRGRPRRAAPPHERLAVAPGPPARSRPDSGHMCAGFWPRLGLTGATGLAAPAGPVMAVTACWGVLVVAAVAGRLPPRAGATGV